MRRSTYMLLLILIVLSLTSCGAPEPAHTNQAGTSDVVHTGDMWYLPVNLPGLPESNIEEIFAVIQEWQAEHQDLQIVDVDYLYMQNTYSQNTSNFTYGVSVLTDTK